jgi:hypothetical protein
MASSSTNSRLKFIPCRGESTILTPKSLEDLEIYSHWRNGKLEKVLCSFKLL